MSSSGANVGLFVLPQEFPCGEGSTCCGPVGQTPEEIAALQAALEAAGVQVELHNATDGDVVRKHPAVARILGGVGPSATPICTVGEEVVSASSICVEDVVTAVREKLVSS
jgi:hypothetical protein